MGAGRGVNVVGELTRAQQSELAHRFGVYANEACDKCGRPLDYVRYTRKDEAGMWCSRVCRDGQEAAERYKATRKKVVGRCWHCGLPLPTEMPSDSRYCDSTCKRNASFAKVGGRKS
jgi:hypothetical protein